MTLARDQKRNLSPRRPSFWAKNQFGACGEGHFTSKTGFRSAARVISHQKQSLGPRRPSFHVKNRILLQTEARFAGFGYTSASIGVANGAFGYTFPTKTRRATT